MRTLRGLALCAVLLAGPTGCITWFTDPMGYKAAFDQTQRQYTQYLRWGELGKASAFVDPSLREAFLKQAPAFESMRITDFEIGEVAYTSESATVTVTYQGYSLDTFVERKIREDQNWHRQGSGWLVRSDIGGFSQVLGDAQH